MTTNASAPPPGVDPARVVEWLHRARTAGHPVIEVRAGRHRPVPVAVPLTGAPINDQLDHTRETARARVAWVSVILPTPADVLALGEAIRPTAPAPPRGRAGIFGRLAGRPRTTRSVVGPVGPLAVADTLDDVTTHVLEIPVPWLDHPVTVIRRPTLTVEVA